MKIVESYLQSKSSLVSDNGGEDRIVVTENYAAVIDGATSKTDKQYDYNGIKNYTSGRLAADILAAGVKNLPDNLNAQEVCEFLNNEIYKVYCQLGIVSFVEEHPEERFMATMALCSTNNINNYPYVMFAGDCQAVINGRHYQPKKLVDSLNANARVAEINRLIEIGELTEEELLAMDVNDDPGRKLILNPPNGRPFPGLKGQSQYQNNPEHVLGYFMLDGFKLNFKTPGFLVVEIAMTSHEIVLATDGYLTPNDQSPAEALSTLYNAEQGNQQIIANDPGCYKLYKGTKGKGTNASFDDRAYLKIRI